MWAYGVNTVHVDIIPWEDVLGDVDRREGRIFRQQGARRSASPPNPSKTSFLSGAAMCCAAMRPNVHLKNQIRSRRTAAHDLQSLTNGRNCTQ
jgi:hypothetical protein